MKTVEMQLDDRSIDRQLPVSEMRQALVNAGMWDGDDERDPAQDHAAAWALVGRMTKRIGQGVILSMAVSDAFNGYGRIEDWVAVYQAYTETCKRCEETPDHHGRHSWRREWVRKFSGKKAFTAELAICHLALRYAFEVGVNDE